MLKTSAFFFIFWVVLVLSIVLLPLYFFFKIAGLNEMKKNYVFFVTNNWARFTLFTAGIKLNLSGSENIPGSHSGFVVISNHQGSFDIPVFIACLPFSAGFIAKKELMKLPFLSTWMRAINCLPIDRSNPRESRKQLINRIQQSDLNPIFLFPEGTRSKSQKIGVFRTGTLKLLFANRIDILPVTIINSYKCFEENDSIRGGVVKVNFHPVIKSSQYEVSGFEKFNDELKEIIAEPIRV